MYFECRTETSMDHDWRYGRKEHLVDYILGITHQIWECGGMERIRDYYDEHVEVFALDGITMGAEEMLQSSKAFLAAFPDRRMIGDAVIWKRESNGDCYSSHRILSPMTNLGDSMFAPATGKRVQIMNIADCVVREGRVVKEWLVRDNLALLKQLAIDPLRAARTVAASRGDRLRDWEAAEVRRLEASETGSDHVTDHPEGTAWHLLSGVWQSSGSSFEEFFQANYSPYAVLHRSPIEYYSGRRSIVEHYARSRVLLRQRRVSLDHVCAMPFDDQGMDLAARWTMRCTHSDAFEGVPASGKTLLILGVTHWRLLGGRVLREWSVYDQLALLAQMLVD